MDIPRSKKADLQKEFEEYIREEESRKSLFPKNENFPKSTDKETSDREYEDYLKNEASLGDLFEEKERVFRKKTSLAKKIPLVLGSVLILSVVVYCAFIFTRIHYFSKNINAENGQVSLAKNLKSTALSLIQSERKELSGEKTGRINLLLLGAAGEKDAGRNLTDTIMVASIDTEKKKIALLSLPRDLYVKIPETNSSTKINGLYQYGLRNGLGAEPVKKAVESVTGLGIDYYLLVDFDGFVKFIDALGGINVNVERDIYDTRYPGPNYSYQTFELKKGYQKLDGETALKYVRERHSDPQGDFGRAKRQQQVMQSVKNKAFSIGTILNPLKINEILSGLEKNVRTDLSLDDIESLLVLSKELDTQNISTKVVDAWKKDSLLKVSHVFHGNTRAFILVPRAGNYSQIQDLAENIFDLEKIEQRKTLMEKEAARVLIVDTSPDKKLPQKIKSLLSENMKIRDIEISTQPSIQQPQETQVFDLTEKSKIFTLDEIVKSVPAKLSHERTYDDFKKYDFVIVLGKDIVDAYKFEEDDVEQFRNAQDAQDYFEIKE